MSDQYLLKSKRNQVFALFLTRNLEPGQFEWVEASSRKTNGMRISRLTLRSQPYFYYEFDYLDGKDYAQCSPGAGKRVETNYPGAWNYQLQAASSWLARVEAELDAPDLWGRIAELQQGIEFPQIDGISDTPFSADEADSIAESLAELKVRLVEHYDLSDEQSESVGQKLDYLAMAARTQGRVGWAQMAIGALITIAWSISPSDLPYYWQLVKGIFFSVTHLLPGS